MWYPCTHKEKKKNLRVLFTLVLSLYHMVFLHITDHHIFYGFILFINYVLRLLQR